MNSCEPKYYIIFERNTIPDAQPSPALIYLPKKKILSKNEEKDYKKESQWLESWLNQYSSCLASMKP
jgi:hypothetical protein